MDRNRFVHLCVINTIFFGSSKFLLFSPVKLSLLLNFLLLIMIIIGSSAATPMNSKLLYEKNPAKINAEHIKSMR